MIDEHRELRNLIDDLWAYIERNQAAWQSLWRLPAPSNEYIDLQKRVQQLTPEA